MTENEESTPNCLAVFQACAEHPVSDGVLGRWYSPGVVEFGAAVKQLLIREDVKEQRAVQAAKLL